MTWYFTYPGGSISVKLTGNQRQCKKPFGAVLCADSFLVIFSSSINIAKRSANKGNYKADNYNRQWLHLIYESPHLQKMVTIVIIFLIVRL